MIVNNNIGLQRSEFGSDWPQSGGLVNMGHQPWTNRFWSWCLFSGPHNEKKKWPSKWGNRKKKIIDRTACEKPSFVPCWTKRMAAL